MASKTKVFQSNNVFLPGLDEPVPATVEIDSDLGVIVAVHQGRINREEFKNVLDENWYDYGEKWILPGLVECVRIPVP